MREAQVRAARSCATSSNKIADCTTWAISVCTTWAASVCRAALSRSKTHLHHIRSEFNVGCLVQGAVHKPHAAIESHALEGAYSKSIQEANKSAILSL